VKNGLFDEGVSEKWIEKIHDSFVREEENGLLIVDRYWVRLLTSFMDGCNDLGIEVDYILKGCNTTG
jgi:hypothetical protein